LHERYEVKRDIRLMMWALPANGHPMDVLQTTIASMATFYPDAGESNTLDTPKYRFFHQSKR
jgi:citrate synthase